MNAKIAICVLLCGLLILIPLVVYFSLVEHTQKPKASVSIYSQRETNTAPLAVWALGLGSLCDNGPSFEKQKEKRGEANPELSISGLSLLETQVSKNRAMILWVKTAQMNRFIEQTMDQLSRKFILVINDSDASFPTEAISQSSFERLMKCPNFLCFFAQNLDLRGFEELVVPQKVFFLPIGVDFHTNAWKFAEYWGIKDNPTPEAQSNILRNTGNSVWNQRILKVFCDFQHNDSMRDGDARRFEKTGETRADIFKVLTEAQVAASTPATLPRFQLWSEKAKYVFTASPHGNGLDCHRTWEDLCLGCIVIVRTSPLDPLYKDLPVIIVDDWRQVTNENLAKWRDEYSNKHYNFQKLEQMYYWNLVQGQAVEI